MRGRKVIHIVGKRPEFIKLAMLYNYIRNNTSLRQMVIHTGQHNSANMSDIFFEELRLPEPDVMLGVRAHNAHEFIGKLAGEITTLLNQEERDAVVLTYGDTNSTLAGALSARRARMLLLHFESGVRTGDFTMPEEVNRVLTDRLSDVHYCCTGDNLDNLKKEGYGSVIPSELLWTGDLMLDAFIKTEAGRNRAPSSGSYIAATIHRAGNILDREKLSAIISALNTLHRSMQVVIPLHPHTGKRLREFGIELKCAVLEPLGYHEMKRFLCDAEYVVTDSGGVAREAYFARKRSMVVMGHPFWPEIIRANAAVSCNPEAAEILAGFDRVKQLPEITGHSIFGDGKAAQKISEHLVNYLS